MSNKSDGGPAFPQMDAFVDANGERPVYTSHDGMTLRDYFAAKAMSALLYEGLKRDGIATISVIANESYKMADAMLEARER